MECGKRAVMGSFKRDFLVSRAVAARCSRSKFSTATFELCARFARRVHVVPSDRCASLAVQLRARSVAASTHTRDAVPAVAAAPHEPTRTLYLTAPPLPRDLADRHRNALFAMTSTDAAAPAAEAVVEPAPADAKSADADGASAKAKDSTDAGAPIKEVPKPDQPRLPKPDRRDLDKAVAELQEECDAKQARIEELKRAIETRRDARKTVGAASASTKTRIQELNQQFQARMVRGSPTPIADAFADRDDTLRRDTPRPPRPAIATRFSLSTFRTATAKTSACRKEKHEKTESRVLFPSLALFVVYSSDRVYPETSFHHADVYHDRMSATPSARS